MANDSKAYSFDEKMDFFFFFLRTRTFPLLFVISEDEILTVHYPTLVPPFSNKSQRTRTFSLLSVISEDEILTVHYPTPVPPFLDSPSPALPFSVLPHQKAEAKRLKKDECLVDNLASSLSHTSSIFKVLVSNFLEVPSAFLEVSSARVLFSSCRFELIIDQNANKTV